MANHTLPEPIATFGPKTRAVLSLLCQSAEPVDRWVLIGALGRDDDALRVHICWLRKALGADAIGRVKGVGYIAGPKAREALAALEAT